MCEGVETAEQAAAAGGGGAGNVHRATDGDTGGCFCGDLLAFAVQAEQLEEGLSDKEVPHAIALRHQTCCLFNLHMLPRQVAIAAVTARLHGKEVCLFRKVNSTGHDPRGGRLS